MKNFQVQPLKRLDTVGLILTEARHARNLSLKQAAKKLNIPELYLAALESDDWEALPRGDYGRYFLRQYAQFLGLSADKLLNQYPGPNLPQVVQPPKGPPIDPSQAVHPLRRIILIGIALAVVVYLIIAARAVFMPPYLEIITPVNDNTVTSPQVSLVGITRPGTEVLVNNESVEVLESGNFLVNVSLRPGLNTLTIKARKNFSRQAIVIRRIFYKPVLPSPNPPAEAK